MKIKDTLWVAIFCSLSLMAVRSYAQSPVSATPTTKSGSNILTLQTQACSSSATAWEKLKELSEFYDDRAGETSGDRKNAWCEKYDAVETALSEIKTYYEVSCWGELTSPSGDAVHVVVPRCEDIE